MCEFTKRSPPGEATGLGDGVAVGSVTGDAVGVAEVVGWAVGEGDSDGEATGPGRGSVRAATATIATKTTAASSAEDRPLIRSSLPHYDRQRECNDRPDADTEGQASPQPRPRPTHSGSSGSAGRTGREEDR